MTFYEAAVEILRSAGRPLHVKKITELSVSLNLLTHVGREPEKTMSARLAQEVAKSNVESLVRQVRPGVFELREGADPQDARQTIQLRHFDDIIEDDVSAEPNAPALEARGSDDDGSDESSDDARTSRNRRRRRGGRGEGASVANGTAVANGTESASDVSVALPAASVANGTARAPRAESNARRERGGERAGESQAPRERSNERAGESQAPRQRPSRPMHERVISEPGQRLAQARKQGDQGAALAETIGDLSAFILDAMKRLARPLTLQEISETLSESPWADVALLPYAAIYSTLQRANARRAHAGQTPLFKENSEGLWLPASAHDEDLADSFAQLESWKARHRALLQRELQRTIAARSDRELLGMIALVLERLGYIDVARHDAEGDELASFSASRNAGICKERVVVRVFAPDRPITRPDVSAFRGSLHLYGAPRGVIIALGGHDAATREQLDVPNVAPIDVVNDQQLADLMIQTGVGVARVSVETPCLDDGFFA